MLGAIFGDIVGSVYERNRKAKEGFPLFDRDSKFTDDTVLTIATADALLNEKDFRQAYLSWGRRYPGAGYSKRFTEWLTSSNPEPYARAGNGSAMRVVPVGWYAQTMEECLRLAIDSASVSHNHSEGIKGAQAVASAVFLSRTGASKDEIRLYIESSFEYDLSTKWQVIRQNYRFDMTCSGSVPQAIVCFMESNSVEDAIRKAVLLNGDTDTQACIAGGISEAFYGGVDEKNQRQIKNYISLEMLEVMNVFYK